MKKAVFSTFIIMLCALSMVSCGGGFTERDGAVKAAGAFSAMGKDIYSPAISHSDEIMSEADTALLIHLVANEAGGFPYMTQVCFAAMVLNRVEDPYFPHGVRGVVFESGDFSSVLSGKVTGTLPEGFKNSRKFRIAKKAVEEAMSGQDPTNGALYFSTTTGGKSDFTPSFECGGMSFGF